MTATAHAAIGVSLAALIPNPVIGLPIAICSHIICDLIPHWDAGTHFEEKTSGQLFEEAVLDVIVSSIVTLVLLLFLFPNIGIVYGGSMVLASQLFDYLAAPYYMFNMKFPPFSWIFLFQKATNTRLDKPWGIVTQAAVVLFLLIIAKAT